MNPRIASEDNPAFRDLPLEEVAKLIESGEYEVIDVREEEERRQGYIPGSRHVALSAILSNPRQQRFSNRSIFTCAVGERSMVAAEMALALGYKDVINFRGGYNAWCIAGKPIERSLSG